jgi:hypothetical protein
MCFTWNLIKSLVRHEARWRERTFQGLTNNGNVNDFVFWEPPRNLMNFYWFLSSYYSLKDFTNVTSYTPPSCCSSDFTSPKVSPLVYRTEDHLREHQKNLSDMAEVALNHVIAKDSSRSSVGAINSGNKISECPVYFSQVISYSHFENSDLQWPRKENITNNGNSKVMTNAKKQT